MSFSPETKEQLFQTELVPLFQELIKNACVNNGKVDSGQEIRSANTLERYLNAAGLNCQRWEPQPGRVSLMTQINQDPMLPTLCYMGHTDVVPARAEDWEQPPFEGKIFQSDIWGRGAVDMLCWTASQAVAIANLAKHKIRMNYNLKYLALADEEASGTWGARYLTENFWDQVACDLMITELGGFFLKNQQGLHAVLTLSEKGLCWLKLVWRGTSAHGSMPFGADNALLKAAQAAQRLTAWQPPPTKDPIYAQMLSAFGKVPTEELSDLERGLAAFLHTAGRTTISPNLLQSGTKTNLIPDRAELILDIRFLGSDFPDSKPESVISLVKRLLGPQLCQDCTFEVLDFFPPTQTSLDHSAIDVIRNLLKVHHPQAKLMPCRIGGVTDGRFWRKRGVPVFGFSLFDTDLTIQAYSQRIHGANEKISLQSLRKCLEFFLDFPCSNIGA